MICADEVLARSGYIGYRDMPLSRQAHEMDEDAVGDTYACRCLFSLTWLESKMHDGRESPASHTACFSYFSPAAKCVT